METPKETSLEEQFRDLIRKGLTMRTARNRLNLDEGNPEHSKIIDKVVLEELTRWAESDQSEIEG